MHLEQLYQLFVHAGYDMPTISRMTPEVTKLRVTCLSTGSGCPFSVLSGSNICQDKLKSFMQRRVSSMLLHVFASLPRDVESEDIGVCESDDEIPETVILLSDLHRCHVRFCRH
jgi:hypothetical protein